MTRSPYCNPVSLALPLSISIIRLLLCDSFRALLSVEGSREPSPGAGNFVRNKGTYRRIREFSVHRWRSWDMQYIHILVDLEIHRFSVIQLAQHVRAYPILDLVLPHQSRVSSRLSCLLHRLRWAGEPVHHSLQQNAMSTRSESCHPPYMVVPVGLPLLHAFEKLKPSVLASPSRLVFLNARLRKQPTCC